MDALPENILLDIFDFCGINARPERSIWKWDRLVHVCRRWRRIVFASPKRLDIRLFCAPGTPVITHLTCWPAFPIIIDYCPVRRKSLSPSDEDNVLSALEHSNRVCTLDLTVTTTQLEKLVMIMQKSSYPTLGYLGLVIDDDDETPGVLPCGFLNGSVSCLKQLELDTVSFPALPTLLASARNLVKLHLYRVHESGYISPEAMAAGLAASPHLLDLFMGFNSFESLPNRTSHPLVTRVVVPALTSFEFEGASDYLEDLVARIDCPKLKGVKIWYFHRHASFRTAQLFEFINRSEEPLLRQFRRLDVRFVFDICLQVSHTIDITLRGTQWGLSHIVQLFDQFSTKLCDVQHLSIGNCRRGPEIGGNEWLQLLHPFTTVRTLYVSRLWVEQYHRPSREEITGKMGTEEDVLPALGLLCIDCPQAEFLTFFENFVAYRRHSGRPLTTVRCDWEFQENLRSYLSEEDEEPFK